MYRDKIKKYVKDKLDLYSENKQVLDNEYDHIVNIAISIIETKYPDIGPGYKGGGFVQNFVDNKLIETISVADKTNVKFIDFYIDLVLGFDKNKIKK